MIDPNVRTNEAGEQFVLEPGDEGYVEPNLGPNAMPPEPHEEGEPLSVELPVQQVGGEGEVPPQDLRLLNEPGQSESEAIIAARGTVVDSTSPTDLVPNTPQIRMGPQEAAVVEAEEPEAEPEVEVEPEAETGVEPEPWASANDLIDQARVATTAEELDAIEQQADGRVTVLNAVQARRAELAQ